ncbi:MAG: ABC transporter permease [Ruminococcaceae bacterium]|nr:ABC transporter permease [Oscillospiraceae bacterium]
MKELLRFEFRKLFQMKTLYIFAGVIVAVLTLNIVTYKFTDVLLQSDALEATGMDFSIFFSGPFDGKKFLVSALLNTEAVLSLAVVISLINCSDFSSGAIKNIFAKGYSRLEVLFAKITASMFVALIFTAISYLFGFFLGCTMWQDIGSDWNLKIIWILLVQIMLMFAYSAMFCFMASFIKKTAGTMVLSIGIPMSFEIIFLVINVLVNDKNFNINNYWIQGNITNLSDAAATNPDIIRALVVAVFYFGIFTLANVLVSRKREV